MPSFNIDPTTFILSLIFSSIGFVYLTFGRKQARLTYVFAGLFLMIYPYFVDSIFWSIGLGVVAAVYPIMRG